MLSVNPSLECVYSIESGPCERVDVFHVSDDWIGYNVSDWFMRDMTTKELIIMADPNRPRHYEEEFKRQIVQSQRERQAVVADQGGVRHPAFHAAALGAGDT